MPLGHLGKTEEAAEYIDRLSRLDPEFSLDQMTKVYPFRKETDRNHYIEGLRKAGVTH